MKSIALLVLCFAVTGTRANVVDVAPQRARPLPPINWMDETGRSRELNEFSGYPLILLPIYTRCPGPCLQNVERLKNALASSVSDPRRFRVLLFSFDPTDSADTLAKYRAGHKIPLGWSVGTASQKNIDSLLEALGVQVGKTGNEFTHPNILVFVDSNLRIAKWIYGTDFSGADIDRALNIAGGDSDWIGQHAQLLYSILLFFGSLLCVALCYSLAQLKSVRRLSDVSDSVPPVVPDH